MGRLVVPLVTHRGAAGRGAVSVQIATFNSGTGLKAVHIEVDPLVRSEVGRGTQLDRGTGLSLVRHEGNRDAGVLGGTGRSRHVSTDAVRLCRSGGRSWNGLAHADHDAQRDTEHHDNPTQPGSHGRLAPGAPRDLLRRKYATNGGTTSTAKKSAVARAIVSVGPGIPSNLVAVNSSVTPVFCPGAGARVGPLLIALFAACFSPGAPPPGTPAAPFATVPEEPVLPCAPSPLSTPPFPPCTVAPPAEAVAEPAVVDVAMGPTAAAPLLPPAWGAEPIVGSPANGMEPSMYGFAEFAAVGAGRATPVGVHRVEVCLHEVGRKGGIAELARRLLTLAGDELDELAEDRCLVRRNFLRAARVLYPVSR